jgi:TolA-binding protein
VRTLRGQVDQLSNDTSRGQADLQKQLGDMNFALQQGGKPGIAPPAPSPSAPPPSGPAPTALSPPPGNLAAPAAPPAAGAAAAAGSTRRTPELALQEGRAALARRDYAAAEVAAREVLQNNRTSPRAYDAQFLLAQALSGQRNFAQAAIAYDDTYNRVKTGNHAAESLLGLASSLTAIGEKRAACETVTKLNAEFPRLSPDMRDGAAAVRQRAGCR